MPASHRKHISVSPRLRWLWLLALFAAPVLIASLTQDIGATAHDAAAEHILRGVAFSAAMDDGVLYPRWSQALHWGLGSPLFTFQPPLPYYALDLLHRLGLPHDLGWRWLVAIGLRAGVRGGLSAGAGDHGPALARVGRGRRLYCTRLICCATRWSGDPTRRTASSSTRWCCGAYSGWRGRYSRVRRAARATKNR